MSNTSLEESTLSICANCGKGEEASGDLKSCASCKMVKYCSRDCQIAHRPQHKRECKRRAAELHDEKLFKDHPPTKDCPICMVPLPIDGENKEIFKTCCGKTLCTGCQIVMTREAKKKGKKFEENLCAFCRKPEYKTTDDLMKRLKGHIDKGNTDAICFLGCMYIRGLYGLPQDYRKANELFLQAGEMGCASAYYNLGRSHEKGLGVEIDIKKAKYYFESAAMMGDVQARCLLGAHEIDEEASIQSIHRSQKHFMVAARAGHTIALDVVKRGFIRGHVTKDEYAQTLRAYKKRYDEMKSDARDRAAPLFAEMRRRDIV